MYIPSSVPTTVEEMLAFLQPMISDGFFDSVETTDAQTIACTQNGNTILTVQKEYFDANWTFTPYTAAGTAATGEHAISSIALKTVFRCSGGSYFLTETPPNSTPQAFIIAKTSGGKTGFIAHRQASTFTISSENTYYTTCLEDDTTLRLYTSGYAVKSNLAGADRTILTKLPVVGANGSTDYFTTAFVRNVVQFSETGLQLIGGRRYGCAYFAAITDDE